MKRQTTKNALILVLVSALFFPASSPAAIPLLESLPWWRAQTYLATDIKGVGLIDSYVEDNQGLSYVYDNALAAMAFTVARQFGMAEEILATLSTQVIKTPNGLLFESYNLLDPNGSGQGPVYAGNTAWLLQALNVYQKYTGRKTYAAFQKILADYLLSQQDFDGGIFIMPGNFGKSTEHNLAAFSALYNYGQLNSLPAYMTAAKQVHNFLTTHTWIASETRFRTSVPDPQPYELLTWATDCQALGALALGSNYSPALNWAEANLLVTKQLGNVNVTGFDFNSDRDTVWFEGTLQMALAFKKTGLTVQANKYYTQAIKGRKSDGSILLATNTGTASIYWMLQPWRAAAPTAWLVFYAKNFNPLAIL